MHAVPEDSADVDAEVSFIATDTSGRARKHICIKQILLEGHMNLLRLTVSQRTVFKERE